MNPPELRFFLDSGTLALDLLNTAHGSPDSGDLEGLRSPDHLVAWLRQTGLVDDAGAHPALRAPPGLRILLTEAHRLRDAIRGVVQALCAGERVPPHAVYGLNRALGAARPTSALVVDTAGGRIVDLDGGGSPLAVLAPVARAAADLVVGADPARLRRCASDSCGLWFLDSSKGGRRKWCSMATCGNRAKAAAHRRRHASG